MVTRDRRAVVLGAGMAGLLAARVLSEFYDSVTLVERDVLLDVPVHRKGIPQGRHLHNFLSRGIQVVGELFPGLLDELAAAGAIVIDDDDLSRVYARIGSYELPNTGKLKDPTALRRCQASRSFTEFHIRRRVAALGNVTIVDNHDVLEPILAGDAVVGVRIVGHGSDLVKEVAADLVVDATGRATRTAQFLESHGYGTPTQLTAAAMWSYSCQLMSITNCGITQRMLMANVGADKPRGLLLAYEHDTWMLAIGRPAQDVSPADFEGMRAAAGQVFPAAVMVELRHATPVGETVTIRNTGALWRRYDRVERFPMGLLVFGDALCHLDPIYGQGMTMAALQALTLRDCLHSGTDDLAYRFFTTTSKQIAPVWSLNKSADADASRDRSKGLRWVKKQLRKRIVDLTLRAASKDVAVAERLFRVTSMIDEPSRLQDPGLLLLVMLVNLRHTRAAAALRSRRSVFADSGSRPTAQHSLFTATGSRHA